ncbi:hypothetical protein BH23PLA1_BH23PLA1_31160 [soil metagenome]
MLGSMPAMAACAMMMILAPAFDDSAIERHQLAQLIEGARADVGNISFYFEGTYTVPGERERQSLRLGPDGVKFSYSGTYSRRADGATRVESYLFNHRTETASHYLVANRDDALTVSAKKDDAERASVTIQKPGGEDFKRIGSIGQVLLADVVIDYARSTYRYEFEGFKKLDGHDCVVVRFSLTRDDSLPREQGISDVYWIDLQRGGHVLRHERYLGTNVGGATTNIKLASFRSPDGATVWLPVSGQVEGRISRDPGPPPKRIYTNHPIYIEAYQVVPSSVRINQGLQDEDFTVRPRTGDIVSDHLKKAQYEFGQYVIRSKEPKPRPLTDAEIESKLEMMLSDAEVMAGELKATSVQRRGTTWLQRTPWIVGGLAAAAVGVVLIRRQLSA